MSVFGTARRHGPNRDRNRTTRPIVELFEDRTLLAAQIFHVTDAGDNGDNTNPTVNTLRWAIKQAELPANAGSTVDFQIATGSAPFTINLQTNPLPLISQKTTIDGTTQGGFVGTPVIVVNGSNLASGSGLDLTADGSTIKGLDLVGFQGAGAAGILVASSNNVIQSNFIGVGPTGQAAGPGNATGIAISGSNNVVGGTAGTANTIAFNTGDAVVVTGGAGNAIRANAIFADGGGIVLSGGNDGQLAPTVIAVASVPNLTTIDYQVDGVVGQSYDVDFYAGGALGGPASVFLGSATTGPLATATQKFTASLDVATAVGAGQTVTATATSVTTNNTSMFASGHGLASPFLVTNTNDNVPGAAVGSLRVALADASNSPPPAGQTDAITFNVPGSGTITFSPIAVLPTIHQPVAIDGDTERTFLNDRTVVVQLNGGSQGFDGLVLGTGSDGSTIHGLDIVGFGGAGINVQSNSNTITHDQIGTDSAGQAAGPGNQTGIAISGSNNVVGGTTGSAANTIGFNARSGVSVLSGSANAIRENTYVGSNGPASPPFDDIQLASGANNNQPAPVVVSAIPNADQLFVHLTENLPDNTQTTFDIYQVTTSSSPVRRIFLGTQTVAVLGGSAIVQITAPGLTDTDKIAATATVSANGTSAFSNAQAVGNPLIVTNTLDNGDNVNPDPGSLRAALNFANLTPGSVITFDIAGTGPFTIALAAALPTIDVPMTIDATTQPGFGGQPFVKIDGGDLSGDGLTLGVGSGSSAIRGLEIAHFNGAGIVIRSSNNTIGGSVAGSGNTIDHNTGDAIDVNSGTGNAIRQDLIFANGGGIVLAAGANNNQAAPTIVAATSVTNLTTIDYQVGGAAGQSYTIDFFASSGAGAPASVFLGSVPITLQADGTQGFTATFTALVAAGQEVTATATSAGNGTSPFATGAALAAPFQVTNQTDNAPGSEVGSLRQAILNANSSGPGRTYHITFDIPPASAPFTIRPGTALPAIVVPVTIDGTTQAGVQVDGGDQGFSGFTLGVGSDGSTIEGLTIVHFGGVLGGRGVVIQSSNNTIGGTTAGAANTIGSNATGGVAILSGTGNVVRRNEYTGSNGPLPPVEANDITLNPPANNNPPAPRILGAAFTPGGSTMIVSVQFTFPTAIPAHDPDDFNASDHASLDFYQIVPGAGTRQYLSPTTPDPVEILPSTGDPRVSQTINVTVSVPAGFTQEIPVIATATFFGGAGSTSPPASGTSVFSNEVTATSPTIVSTTADTASGDAIAGSLRFAIDFANSPGNANTTITFALSGTAPFVIGLAAALPAISQPTTIDGTSQPGYAPGVPAVEIDGSRVTAGSGLDLAANDCTIEGLIIVNFKGTGASGIRIEPGTEGNAVRGDLIGTDPSGAKLGNTRGIDIYGSRSTIGGDAPFTGVGGARISPANTIGFNAEWGVGILANSIGASVSSNVVQGNYVGTDAANHNLGNFGRGILIRADDSITSGSATVSGNTIGGPGPGTANTIGFNTGAGVEISVQNSDAGRTLSVLDTAVEGNQIGGSGSTAAPVGGRIDVPTRLPNGGPGILLQAAGTNLSLSGNTIGGPATTTGTIVAGELVSAPGAGANDIWDNAGDGIQIDLSDLDADGAVANTIQGNLVSGNQSNGVHVIGDLTGDRSLGAVVNNFVGTDPTGLYTYDPNGKPWGNGLSGVLLEQSATSSDTASGGVPGMALSVAGNVISGNGLSGVTVQRRSGPALSTARVGIAANIIGLDRLGKQAIVLDTSGATGGGVALPIGNVLDGVLLDNVVGVILGSPTNAGVPAPPALLPSNVISGNLGRGIEVRGDAPSSILSSLGGVSNTIAGNFVGTDASGLLASNSPAAGSTNLYSLGNLSDGVFLLVPPGTTIEDNLISNNRAAGIHVAAQSGNQPTGPLVIAGNVIGISAPDPQGHVIVLGNGSDGVFLDLITSGVTIGGTIGADSNVISGNRANGIDVLDSTGISIGGNKIGTDPAGTGLLDNSANGIFLNGSSRVSIGIVDTVAAGNLISGNLYNGILLANNSDANTIANNRIGTDQGGTLGLGNSADGILLLGGAATIGGTVVAGGNVTGNAISGNTISGNNGQGVQVFGRGAEGNVVSANMIGVGSDGRSRVRNGANGVYLNNDNGNNTIGPGNVISGNAESGVLIFGTLGQGGRDIIRGNKIGTDSSGSSPVGNGGNGLFIYGTSINSIAGNTLSGNAQAGLTIFSPAADAPAAFNTVGGNLIGGAGGLGNRSDGIDLYSGMNNTIGQLDSPNTIIGNGGNGVLLVDISSQPPRNNTISGNDIGTDAAGTPGLGNHGNGVLVQDGTGNSIGVPMGSSDPGSTVPTSPSNVISGNGDAGVAFTGDARGNFVQGNYIGVSPSGLAAQLGNGLAGVFVNNLGGKPSDETIGGAAPGSGNIIGGNYDSEHPVNAGTSGVAINGPVGDGVPAANVIAGNLIGIDAAGDPAGNNVGVLVQNSWGNTIGGGSGNIISANALAGVELTGLFSTRDLIQGNAIGTNREGTGRPGQKTSSPTQDGTTPLQTYGVYILTPSPTFDPQNKAPNNRVLGNLVSGNLVGIKITGVGSGVGTGQGVPFGRDVIAGNLIGTDRSGNAANPNFEYGVYIDNSAANTVGGTGTGGNLISANGVSGVEIVGGTPRTKSGGGQSNAAAARNFIIGNTIGYDRAGGPGFTAGGGAAITVADGPTVVLGQQLYGVVVIGSSSNLIGGKKQGNLIGGNVSTGVYITVQDFKGNIYSTPTNNTLNSNTIVNNGQYGVYRFESPRNSVAEPPQRFANKFSGNPINLADYLEGVGVNTLPAPKSKFGSKAHRKSIKKAHRRPIKVTHSRPHEHHATGHGRPGVSTPARPRIPALFEPGIQTIRIEHVPARRHR